VRRGSVPAHDGAAGGAACGDLVRIGVAVQGDRVVDAGFEAAGCGAAQAAGSAAVELVLGALQTTVLAYLDRDAERIAFWAMVARPVEDLQARADHIVERVDHPAVCAQAMEALPGAGSAPGVTVPSYGVVVRGDLVASLRANSRPVIARVRDGVTMLDLRAVDPADDDVIVETVRAALVGDATAPDR